MKPATLASNAERLGQSSQVAAAAIVLCCGVQAWSGCVWCAEEWSGVSVRLRAGGECARCPYAGPDCLLNYQAEV